jgi:GH15 family glucan-1,4-alpha-glucosidase
VSFSAGDRDEAGYIDLRSYAAVGDGRTVALISRDGRIDWLPGPDLDSPPAFAALLDSEHGGYLSLSPVEAFTVLDRHYLAGTNVLETTYETASGVVRVTDALNTGVAGRLPWLELARRIEGLHGTVEMAAMVSPGSCLNSASPWAQQTPHGPVLRLAGLTMAVRSAGQVDISGGDQHVSVRYQSSQGSTQLLAVVMTNSEPLLIPDLHDIDAGIDRTIAGWQAWSQIFHWDGPWSEAVQRSALALKLLLYSPSGAIAAAATTSLPESVAGGKNWDYRFAWTRDTAYALKALLRFGLREETHAAVSWLLTTVRRHGPEPRVLYTLSGELPAPDSELAVPGWRGIGPVLSGNRASSQLQLGVFGDLFNVVRLYVDHGNLLDAETGRMLAGIADQACDSWHTRDSGMWELPELRHYTTSKLGCWAALRDAVHLAERGQIPGDPARWRSEADRIADWVNRECWNAQLGCYTCYPGSDELDASILLHAVSGFDRGPRMSSTLDVLLKELGDGPHLYRFSGARGTEGSFVACSFWMVAALHLVGRPDEAREAMTALVGTANDVGLFAEMLDPADGSFLGNFPQALSHLALINAAITLTEGDRIS